MSCKYALRMGSSRLLFPTKSCVFVSVAFRAGIISLSVEWNDAAEGGEEIFSSCNASNVFGRTPTSLVWLFVDLFSPSRHLYGFISVRPPFLTSSILSNFFYQPSYYRGTDNSLARPGRKHARKHVGDARDFNNIQTQTVINFFFSAR